MKKTKVLLAGALVLALGLVMGCSMSLDESVEEHTKGDSKFEHVWKADYKNNDQYIRSALQFGSGEDKITEVDVNVDMAYPQHGKAGLIFGLTNTKGDKDLNGKENIKYNYYIVALGENPNKTDGTLQYYIDYCTNMTSLSGGNTAEESIDTSTGAEYTPIVELTDIADVSHKPNEKIEYTVSVLLEEDKDDKAGGTYTVEIKVGGKTITHTINHKVAKSSHNCDHIVFP